MSRKLTALNKLYHHPPTNKEIRSDFDLHMIDAWVAINDLCDFLGACHKDRVLIGVCADAGYALKDLAEMWDRLANYGADEFYLDLPADEPAAATAIAIAAH